jgi:hypothetical protein
MSFELSQNGFTSRQTPLTYLINVSRAIESRYGWERPQPVSYDPVPLCRVFLDNIVATAATTVATSPSPSTTIAVAASTPAAASPTTGTSESKALPVKCLPISDADTSTLIWHAIKMKGSMSTAVPWPLQLLKEFNLKWNIPVTNVIYASMPLAAAAHVWCEGVTC